jgi:glycosyltransferase involved in cell wall biosynthesis
MTEVSGTAGHRHRISVVIPARNASAWIEEALRSVSAQSRRPDEVVVVDDGSSDDTMDVFERLRQPSWRVVPGPQSGLAAALRVGVESAEGDLVARLDADDVAHPDRLRLQEAVFEHQQVSICGGWSLLLKKGVRRRHFAPPTTPSQIARFTALGNPFVHSTVMFRRSQALEVGNYASPSAAPYPEDYDLWLRLLERGLGVNLRQPLVAYRKHTSSLSAGNSSALGTAAVELALSARTRLLDLPRLGDPGLAILNTYHGVRNVGVDRFTPLDVHGFLRQLSVDGERWPPGLTVPWTTRARLLRASLKTSFE